MIVVAGESLVDLIPTDEGALAPLPGGGPFNVARALARLGVPVAFLGTVSTDGFGRTLRDGLAADGVDLGCLVETDLPTTLALAELDDHGSARYRFYAERTAAAALTADDAQCAIDGVGPTALHVGSLGLALEPLAGAVERLVESAAPEVLVMVDPNWRPGAVDDPAAWRARLDRMLARADVVKLSTEDLAHLAPDVAVPEAARGLLSDRTRCVLVTDGGEAVTVACAGGVLEVEPPPVVVADTVGAGDAFGAGFLAWCTAHRFTRESLGDPAQVRDAAGFAALIAARTCARVGADPPRLLELEISAGLAVA